MTAATLLTAAQDAPWYRAFLAPVVEELGRHPSTPDVLDLGTGPGKLLELLVDELGISPVGADTDGSMLSSARARASLGEIPLVRTDPGQPLPFDDATFDAVSICSVLFLQSDPETLLNESMRVLRPHGRMIVLTPTGAGRPSTALPGLPSGQRGRIRNATLFVWHASTAQAGRRWTTLQPLASYAERHGMEHRSLPVFHGMAVLETLQRPWVEGGAPSQVRGTP